MRNSSAVIMKARSLGARWLVFCTTCAMPRAWMARALRMSKVKLGNIFSANGIAMARRLTRVVASGSLAKSAANRLNCSVSCASVVLSRFQIWVRRSSVFSPNARR
ncbi:hypothetical protein D3C72_1979420 [compost metagenome]